jgi:hypothetical protein
MADREPQALLPGKFKLKFFRVPVFAAAAVQ